MFLSSRFSSFPTFIISDGHLEAKFSEPATTFLHLLSQTGRSMEVPRRPSRRPWLQQQIPITVSLVTTFLHLGPLCRIPSWQFKRLRLCRRSSQACRHRTSPRVGHFELCTRQWHLQRVKGVVCGHTLFEWALEGS